MTFEDARIWSRLLTFTQIAGRLFLCVNNTNKRVAYFYLSVMYLKAFNAGTSDIRITKMWGSEIVKTPSKHTNPASLKA